MANSRAQSSQRAACLPGRFSFAGGRDGRRRNSSRLSFLIPGIRALPVPRMGTCSAGCRAALSPPVTAGLLPAIFPMASACAVPKAAQFLSFSLANSGSDQARNRGEAQTVLLAPCCEPGLKPDSCGRPALFPHSVKCPGWICRNKA